MRTLLRRPFIRPGTLLWLGALSCLYLDSFILPSTPIYQGDTAPIYMLEARKMLEGQMIYRDFFQFTLPGTQVFYFLLFKLFGVRAWIPSAVWVLLGTSLAWLSFRISRHVLKGWHAYLPSLLFLAFGFVTEPDPTHHWFSTIACLGALALLMAERTPPRLAAAGALCGLAALFTQSRGAVGVMAIAVYLCWECRARKLGWKWLLEAEGYLWAGLLAMTLPPIAYLIAKVGLVRFISCTVVFMMKYWSKWYWGTFAVYMGSPPSVPVWLMPVALSVWLFLHALIPWVYLWFLARYYRQAWQHPDHPWDRLLLVNTMGIFLFLGVASAPVWFRLIAVAPPAMIMLVWLLDSSTAHSGRPAASLAAFALAVLLGQSLIVQTGWKGYLEAPAGRAVLLHPERFTKYRWILDHTRPGDYFFQSDDCDQYFLLGLRNPAQVSFVVGGDYTRPEQVQDVIATLERFQVRWVMWSAWLDVPRRPGGNAKALAPLRAYLAAHYRPVRTFADDEEEALERQRQWPVRTDEQENRASGMR
jgi:hypothetical protein